MMMRVGNRHDSHLRVRDARGRYPFGRHDSALLRAHQHKRNPNLLDRVEHREPIAAEKTLAIELERPAPVVGSRETFFRDLMHYLGRDPAFVRHQPKPLLCSLEIWIVDDRQSFEPAEIAIAP